MRNQRKADQFLSAEKGHYIYPQFDQIWKRTVLVKRRAEERPETTIPAAVCKQLRIKGIISRGVRSSQGMVCWPPTYQTIMKRCGGSWNNALENMELMTFKQGRARGSLKLSDEKCLQASVEFILHCQQVNRTTAVAYYCQWVAHKRRSGRIWPSAAVQCQLRRAWNHVMELGQKIVQGKTLSSWDDAHWVKLRFFLSFVDLLAIDYYRLNFNPGRLP